MIGAAGANEDVANGLCGAAIVEDSVGSNPVGGFFQLEDGQWCIAPCLDKIVADGWSVVKGFPFETAEYPCDVSRVCFRIRQRITFYSDLE